MHPRNNLEADQDERLAVILEECGESVHMAGKVLRHGYKSTHPDYGNVTNRDNLTMELAHIQAAIEIMIAARDLDRHQMHKHKLDKLTRLLEFFHEPNNKRFVRELLKDYEA